MKKELLVALISFQFFGCATSSLYSFKDSSLTNPDPAPKNLAPDSLSSENPLVDPVYMTSQADYHFTLAESLSLEGKSQKAIEEFRLTLLYDPQSVLVHLRMATEYIRLGMITEAIENAQVAVDLDPKNVDARMLMGGLYTSLKSFDKALVHYRKVLEVSPYQAEAAILVGGLLAEQKKYKEAIDHLENLTKAKAFEEPEKAFYFIGRIRTEQDAPQLDLAERAFRRALTIKPDFPEAAYALAGVLKKMGKETESMKLLKSFQDKYGPQRDMAQVLSQYYLASEDYDRAYEQLSYLEGFDRDNLNVKVQMALILVEKQKYEEAAERFEEILLQSPESDKIRFYLGAVYEELARWNLAQQNYEKVPASSTYYVDAVVHEAQIEHKQKSLASAIEIVEKAVDVRSDQAPLYAYLASLFDEAKQYTKAEKMLLDATQKFPKNAQLQFFLGSIYDRLGKTDKLTTQMRKVLDLDPEHAQAMNYLAYVLADKNIDLAEAEHLARTALDLQPQDPYVLDTMGWVFFKQGKMDLSVQYLEAAYKLRSDEAVIVEHLADAYFKMQMIQKAEAYYIKSMELSQDEQHKKKIENKLVNIERQKEPSRLPASVHD